MKRLQIPLLVLVIILGWVAVAAATPPNLFNTSWIGASRVMTFNAYGQPVPPSILSPIVFRFTTQSLNTTPTPPIANTALVAGTVQIQPGPILPFTAQITPVSGSSSKFTLLMSVKESSAPTASTVTLITATLSISTLSPSQNKIQGVFQDLTDGTTGDFSATKR